MHEIENENVIESGRYAGKQPALKSQKEYYRFSYHWCDSADTESYYGSYAKVMALRLNNVSASSGRKEVIVDYHYSYHYDKDDEEYGSEGQPDRKVGEIAKGMDYHTRGNLPVTIVRNGHLLSLYKENKMVVTVDSRDSTIEFGKGVAEMQGREWNDYRDFGVIERFIEGVRKLYMPESIEWDITNFVPTYEEPKGGPYAVSLKWCKQLGCPVYGLRDSDGEMWYYEAKANGRRLTHDQFWSVVRLDSVDKHTCHRLYSMLALDGVRVQRVGFANRECATEQEIMLAYLGSISNVWSCYEPDNETQAVPSSLPPHVTQYEAYKLPQGIYDMSVSKNTAKVVLKSPIKIADELLDLMMEMMVEQRVKPTRAWDAVNEGFTGSNKGGFEKTLEYLGERGGALEDINFVHKATERLRKIKNKATTMFDSLGLPMTLDNRMW